MAMEKTSCCWTVVLNIFNSCRRKEMRDTDPLLSRPESTPNMASQTCMPDPVCLIENTEGQLVVNQEALEILSSITEPVVVVAIVGLYRTGKSYLMNNLAGKKKGFSLGSTVQSHTKGIWMWCVPHPRKPGHTLVLFDTEGLGDVEKGDNQNDCWIFTLAVLLSSTFVYNSMGTINQHAMDQLHYVTELTKRIRAHSSPKENEVEDSADFVSFFPDFVWTLRDVTLKLEIDGQSLTADEYLDNSLKLKQGNSEEQKKYNLPRLCIRKFFPKKKCFALYPPTEWKKLGRLETLNDDELDADFLQQVEEFCSYIFDYSEVKTLPGGIKVNGPRLEILVMTYIKAISSGDLPCMENAVLALAKKENLDAIKKATTHYDQQMNQKVQLPTNTLQELLDLHRACEREAIEIFIRNSFKDVDHSFQKELAIQLEKRLNDICKQNLEASSDHCKALLQDIFSPLEEEVKQGTYSKPGGYHLLTQNIQNLKEKYLEAPRKGIQAEEILQTYLKSKEAMFSAILQTDQTLTEKQKAIEEERKNAETAQATAKLLEDTQKKNEQMMEQREKSYQEHVKLLTEKMERDREQLIAEQERTVALKLQEQERLLKDGFIEENRRLQKEIENVEKRHQETMDHMKAESLQTNIKMLDEMQNYKEMIKEKEKNHKEQVKKIKEMMEWDRTQLIADQERTLNFKLQEQELLFKEKFLEERNKYQKDIQDMKEKNREIRQSLGKAKAQSSQTTAMLEELQKANQQMKELGEKNYQNSISQYIEMMEKARNELIAEQQRIQTLKIKNLEDYFNEKIKQMNELHTDEINNIKKKQESNSHCSMM